MSFFYKCCSGLFGAKPPTNKENGEKDGHNLDIPPERIKANIPNCSDSNLNSANDNPIFSHMLGPEN